MQSKQTRSGEKWSVAFACCFVNFILDGIGRLVGIFFVATLEEFPRSDRQSAALPYSLCTSIRNLSGPLVGLLAKHHGIRKVTACGALLSALGIGLCFVAPSILWVTILWGGIFGVGYGLGNVLLPAAISENFQENQATANGISFAGSCLGSFVLPSLFYYLLDGFGLRGLFLITSAIVLHCFPASLLLRSRQFSQEPHPLPTSGQISKSEKNNEDNEPACWNTEIDSTANSDCSSGMYEDVDTCFESSVAVSQKTVTSLKSLTSNRSVLSEDAAVDKGHNAIPTKKPLVLRVSVIECTFTCDSRFPSVPSHLEDLTAQRNVFRSRSVPLGCYDNSTFADDGCEIGGSNSLHANDSRINDVESGTCVNAPKTGASALHKDTMQKKSCRDTILESLRIFSNKSFLIITFAMATYEFVFIAVITVMIDFSKDLGVSQDKAKWIFMVFSAGDLFGRLCLGWITDKKIMSRNCFTALCFLGMTGTLLGMSISDGFHSLLGSFGAFGVFESGAIIMFPLIMVQCIQPEDHTVAIASSNLLPGVAALAVPPTIGYFRDVIGSYLGLFYILGAVSVVSSILCLSLPHLASRHQSQR